MTTTTVSWRDVIKKEARGNNDYDLGEVQEIGTYYVHTQKGIAEKTQFYIPKKLFRNYDGSTVHFNVDESNINQFIGKRYPSDEEYRAKYETPVKEKTTMAGAGKSTMTETGTSADIIERIPLMSERLDVSKHVHKEEVTVTKVPYTETQTKEIPVTHEELRIETRPASSTNVPEMKRGLEPEEIRIPLEHEDVDVKKTPIVREEIVIRKRPVTETRRVSEDIRSEKFETSDNIKRSTYEEEKKKHQQSTT